MKKRIAFDLELLMVLCTLVLLIVMPADAAAGAKKGLSICGGVIVPGLLPFLILSRLISALGLPMLLAEKTAPLFRRFGISPAAPVPLLLGLIGGYPVGAVMLGDMVRRGELSSPEAERLLPCCNNTGPAFIVGAVGGAVFGSVKIGLLLWFSHAASALAMLLLFGKTGAEKKPALPPLSPPSPAEALPEAVRNAADAVISISAFVVFFSVLTALLRSVGIFGAAALFLVRRFGAEPRSASALLTGLLELGSGIGAMAGLPADGRNLILASFLLGFGGLSVHCQTLSVLSGTDIKCARHFVGRILHGLLSAGISSVLFRLLQI